MNGLNDWNVLNTARSRFMKANKHLLLWSSLVAPLMRCDVEHFSPGEMEAARDWLMWPEGAVD